MRMPRRVLFVVLILALAAGGLGLVAGYNSPVSETDVINAGAVRYVRETGGDAIDCVGLPGEGRIWIEVRCGDGDRFRAYLFNDQGELVSTPKEPRT